MRRASILLLPPLVLIFLLWLPFGFHMGGILEEWGLLGLYSQHGPFFFAGPGSLLPAHTMRPLMTSTWALAYAVAPDSWWFWHFELAVSLLIKGASVTWLMLYLGSPRRWAVATGLLYMVWPADTLQMSFRALNIGMSAGLVPLFAALLLAAYESASRLRALVLASLAAACLIVGAWMYELTLLLTPLPFLLMWARDGFAASWRRMRVHWVPTAVLVAVIAACGGYILYVLATVKQTYQESVTGDRKQVLATLKSTLPMLFSRGFIRALAGGWVDAARVAAQDLRASWYLLVVALFAGVSLWRARGGEAAVRAKSWRIVVAGALALAAGYAAFLVSPAHLNISQRTFLMASIGAALVFGAGLMSLGERFRLVTGGLAVLLVTLGTAQQLYQFREYGALYERQRVLIRAILEQVQELPAGKTLLVLDYSQQLAQTWMLNGNLGAALTYVSGKSFYAHQVCLMPQGVWTMLDMWARQGTCVEGKDSWTFRSEKPLDPAVQQLSVTVPKADIVTVTIRPDGTAPDTPAVARNRETLNSDSSVVGRRYTHLLRADSWPLRFLAQNADPSSYRWDFGRRWSLEQPFAGSGWGEGDWAYEPFRSRGFVWIRRPDASLVFPLTPEGRGYELVIKTMNPWSGPLKLRINGQEIPAGWPPNATRSVIPVPRDTLKGGMNMLELLVPYSENGLVTQVDQMVLQPQPR